MKSVSGGIEAEKEKKLEEVEDQRKNTWIDNQIFGFEPLERTCNRGGTNACEY